MKIYHKRKKAVNTVSILTPPINISYQLKQRKYVLKEQVHGMMLNDCKSKEKHSTDSTQKLVALNEL